MRPNRDFRRQRCCVTTKPVRATPWKSHTKACRSKTLQIVRCPSIQHTRPSNAAPSLGDILSAVFCPMQASFARTKHQWARFVWLRKPGRSECSPPQADDAGTALAQAIAWGDFFGAETRRARAWRAYSRASRTHSPSLFDHSERNASGGSLTAHALDRVPREVGLGRPPMHEPRAMACGSACATAASQETADQAREATPNIAAPSASATSMPSTPADMMPPA